MSRSQTSILTDILALTQKYQDEFQHHFPARSSRQPHPSIPFDIDMAPLYLTAASERFKTRVHRSSLMPLVQEATLRRVADITNVYQETFAKACRRLLSTGNSLESCQETIQVLRQTLEARFEKFGLGDLLSQAERSQAKHFAPPQRLHSSQVGSIGRRPFNTTFTPFLEAYFEQNAYPSAADQELLARKGNMDRVQITTWFQNHRNRLRSAHRDSDIKRLPPGQAVNVELIEERLANFIAEVYNSPNSDSTKLSTTDPVVDLDSLARPRAALIGTTFEKRPVESCVSSAEAFGLHTPSQGFSSQPSQSAVTVTTLAESFADVNIRISPHANVSGPTCTSKSSKVSSRSSTPAPKTKSRSAPLKATLRSCFSAAITLTCPRSHPALIRRKGERGRYHPPTNTSTVLEQKRSPIGPYKLPLVLPTWELPAPHVQESPAARRKPTIASHAGKTRPGSPYPHQTISRVSSSSSLTSMASDDSLWSSHTTSSNHSATSVESFATTSTSSQSQSPFSTYSDLADDAPFAGDIWSSNFYSNPVNDNFGFDIAVENPFDMNVSLSIADFDTTTLPTLEFFDS